MLEEQTPTLLLESSEKLEVLFEKQKLEFHLLESHLIGSDPSEEELQFKKAFKHIVDIISSL